MIGTGPILSIQSRDSIKSLRTPLLLAPLIGFILVGAVGVLKLTWLMLPLQPVLTIIGLLFGSLGLCWINRQRFLDCLKVTSAREYLSMVIPALAFTVYFSFIFHAHGIELLSGSEDEYQYCSNAVHMLYHQNTAGPSDIPIPRIDHWLYDWQTRFLCYWKDYRRGAEVLLASTMGITGLPAPTTFPVLCGFLIATLSLSMGSVARDCLRLDSLRTGILQAGFAFLFYFMLLHIQGSLANLCSIPCYLGGLAILSQCVSNKCCARTAVFGGILLGGGILFYPEVASFELLLPLFVVFIEKLLSARLSGFNFVVRRFAVVCAVGIIVSTQSAMAVIPNIVYNVSGVKKSQTTSSNLPITTSDIAQSPLRVQIGLSSYYANGIDEVVVDNLFADRSERFLPYCLAVYAIALIGFLRLGRRCRALQVPFIALLLMFGPLLVSHDALRIARAFGYSIPFLFIGLVLATTPKAKFAFVPKFAAFALGMFLALNAFCDFRTVAHITSNSVRTDTLVRRLNPNSEDWNALRSELARYPHVPVLISEFEDTPTPHKIIIGIEPHPNILGESITRFWRIQMSKESVIEASNLHCVYKNHQRPLKEIAQWDWSVDYPRMIDQSEQAIVPAGGRFPREWSDWSDVLPAYRTRYTNICDVVYKHKLAIQKDKALGPLERDTRDKFRLLRSAWTPILFDDRFAIYVMKVIFDGVIEDLEVHGIDCNVAKPMVTPNADGTTTIEIPVASIDFGKLVIIPARQGIKIRTIELKEVRNAN